jgi:hypothetical protein
MSRTPAVARLKITLDHVEPKVIRRIEAPLRIRLDRLHLVIQAAMGWTNSHLYGFEAGGVDWGEADMDFGDGPLPASKTTLADVMEDIGAKTIHYVYDYGDNWDHTIKVERIEDAAPGVLYPRLIKAEGRCPPEDVGGPPGYEMYLEAMADPKHDEHDWMIECYGGPYDPRVPEIEAIVENLERLARKWAPRARKPKKPPS